MVLLKEKRRVVEALVVKAVGFGRATTIRNLSDLGQRQGGHKEEQDEKRGHDVRIGDQVTVKNKPKG